MHKMNKNNCFILERHVVYRYVPTRHWVKLGDELIKTTFRHEITISDFPFTHHIVGKGLQKSHGKSSTNYTLIIILQILPKTLTLEYI